MTRRTRLSAEVLDDRRLPSFTPAGGFPPGAYPQAADFNNDGLIDVATVATLETEEVISVRLGNGDGTFRPQALTSPVGLGPWEWPGPFVQSVAVGDFNADGTLDLAAATNDYYATHPSVLVLIGRGDGTFAPGVGAGYTGIDSNSVAAGDLNEDGKLDLVVTSFSTYGVYASVNVLLGRGDGTFASSFWSRVNDAMPYADYPVFLGTPVLADFDGDGHTDVAVSGDELEQLFVKVLPGNGDGTLGLPSNAVTVPHAPRGYYMGVLPASAGDFNRDGRVDLVAGDVVWMSVSGAFRAAGSIGAAADAVGDINGDGRLDLVSTSSAGDLNVHLGIGDGTFVAPVAAGTGTARLLADFEGDGRLDAATDVVLLNDGVWDVPPPPAPSLAITDVRKAEGRSGATLFTFTVTLSAPSTTAVTVNYSTANGSAAAGSDYAAASGTLTFAPGETTKTITVKVSGDRKREADETFFVNLSGVGGGALLLDPQAVGTILNDD